MIIKFGEKDNFINFYEKHTNEATIFYFDNSDSQEEGVMICDSKYTIIYQFQNHEERNNIIDYFNSNNVEYVIVYQQSLPSHDLYFDMITL